MNNNIIYNLILLKEKLIKENKEENKFKINTLNTTIKIIKKLENKITSNNVNDLSKFKGIGEKTIEKIREILEKEKNNSFEKDNNIGLITELEQVVGIGYKLALDFINKGVVSINDLKEKVNNNELKVNDKIKMGLKYYSFCYGKIPRKEIQEIEKLLLKLKKKCILTICGSYRRCNEYSNDIDVLITINDSNDENLLKNFINNLKEPLEENNKKPLIIDDLTDKNFITKYMGFLKYKNNPIRRIDIRYILFKYYNSALLYFTGSVGLNVLMRKKAKQLGYKLSEYGLYDIQSKKYIENIDNEKKIFEILNMKYLKPCDRNI